MRLKGTSSFREQTALLSTNIKKLEYDKAHGYMLGEFFDNRRVDYAKTIIRGYLIHFWPRWLFVAGDHERHHAPGMGLLYVWEIPFILLGIYLLLRHRKHPSSLLFLGWLALAPIAASPTTQLPHAIRTLVFLPAFQVLTAIGYVYVFWWVKTQYKIWYKPVFIGMSVMVIGGLAYYAHMYFAHTNQEYSNYWLYGYEKAVAYAESHKGEFEKVVVSTDLEQPYIFFLFYTKYDPKKYLAAGGTVSGSFDEGHNRFDMYEFRKIDWPNEKRDGSILYIGTPEEIVHGTRANITYLDGAPAINITDRE
jgi:prepilin-type processing-associated H-X9-DG protein